MRVLFLKVAVFFLLSLIQSEYQWAHALEASFSKLSSELRICKTENPPKESFTELGAISPTRYINVQIRGRHLVANPAGGLCPYNGDTAPNPTQQYDVTHVLIPPPSGEDGAYKVLEPFLNATKAFADAKSKENPLLKSLTSELYPLLDPAEKYPSDEVPGVSLSRMKATITGSLINKALRLEVHGGKLEPSLYPAHDAYSMAAKLACNNGPAADYMDLLENYNREQGLAVGAPGTAKASFNKILLDTEARYEKQLAAQRQSEWAELQTIFDPALQRSGSTVQVPARLVSFIPDGPDKAEREKLMVSVPQELQSKIKALWKTSWYKSECPNGVVPCYMKEALPNESTSLTSSIAGEPPSILANRVAEMKATIEKDGLSCLEVIKSGWSDQAVLDVIVPLDVGCTAKPSEYAQVYEQAKTICALQQSACEFEKKRCNDQLNQFINDIEIKATRVSKAAGNLEATRLITEFTPGVPPEQALKLKPEPEFMVPLSSARYQKKIEKNGAVTNWANELGCNRKTMDRETLSQCERKVQQKHLAWLFDQSVRLMIAGSEQLKIDKGVSLTKAPFGGIYQGAYIDLFRSTNSVNGMQMPLVMATDPSLSSCTEGIANISNRPVDYDDYPDHDFILTDGLKEEIVDNKLVNLNLSCRGEKPLTVHPALPIARGRWIEESLKLKRLIEKQILNPAGGYIDHPSNFSPAGISGKCTGYKKKIDLARELIKSRYDRLNQSLGGESIFCNEATEYSSADQFQALLKTRKSEKKQNAHFQQAVCSLEAYQTLVEFDYTLQYAVCVWQSISSSLRTGIIQGLGTQ